MDGDTLPGGKTRPAQILTSTDGSISVTDKDEYAGSVFETDHYTGAGGTVDTTRVDVPTSIGSTATRTRSGLPALTASMVGNVKTVNREKVSYGWRTTESDTFYNTTVGQSTTGMPVQAVDRGEVGAAGNVTTCTFTRYLDGANAPQVFSAEVITTDQDCTNAGATPSGNLISDVRTSYDGNTFAYNGQSNVTHPAKGNPTLVQTASAASGATATKFIDSEAVSYDGYGRAVSTTRTPNSTVTVHDTTTSLSRATYTKISPASGALPSSVTTVTQVTPGFDCSTATTSSTNCQVSKTVLDPARQLTTAQTDVAGTLTTVGYDALGRTTAVWLPNENQTMGAKPNSIYSYTLSATGPSVVTTGKLADDDSYVTSEVLYDALLRPLETQAVGENGSTIVTDTQYDSHGWTVLTNNAYAFVGSPISTLVSDHMSQVSVPSTTAIDHDAMGRVTQVTEEHDGTRLWYTRTAYTGDKTSVFPPAGAVATTRTVNARDQVTQLDQYTVAPTLSGTVTGGFTATGGTAQSITYGYNAAGKQTSVTGPDQSSWHYVYDLLGRQTSQTDPDSGTNVTAYDDAGNVLATRDSRNIFLYFTHDLLGRRLTALDKTKGWFEYASWEYDTLRIGKPTSSTRYVSGVTGGYTIAATGYSMLGSPLGQKITLPSVERPLPSPYTTSFTYTSNTELPATQTDPAVGGLPGEKITYGHDLLGAPTKASGVDLYVADAKYTDFGQPSDVTMGDSTNPAHALYSYDEPTQRLIGRTVMRDQAPGPTVDQTAYTYNDAGNPLSVTDQQSETGSIVTDTQCYRYDGLARLAQAWTAADACPDAATTQPGAGTVAGSAGAYWQSYAYDAVGDRTQLTDHATNGGADVTTTYTNGVNGTHPHALASTSGSSDPTTFGYDAQGHLISRAAASGNNQTLKWDDEGNLSEVDNTGPSAGVTKYLYDADGNQLIRRDPGRTTLFAGDTEVVINTSSSPAVSMGAVRTYTDGSGQAVAVRSTLPGSSGSDYLFSDPVGTATMAMDTTTQKVSRQQNKPYGEPRTSNNTTAWPDMTHGYLGAAQDTSTGYTDTGARKYDPSLGRFISLDPILVTTDSNQLGGYSYAGDNPAGDSDPSGLMSKGDAGGCGGGNGTPYYLGPTGLCMSHSTSRNLTTPGSSVLDGIDHAFEGAAKSALKLTVDVGECKARLGCDGLKQDGKAVATQAFTTQKCWKQDLAACKEVAASFGCGKLDGECLGHLIFYLAVAALTDGAGEVAAGSADAAAETTDVATAAAKVVDHRAKAGGTAAATDGDGIVAKQSVTDACSNCGVTLLGKYRGAYRGDPSALKNFLDNPDFNILRVPPKGTGSWRWNVNKQFIDDAIGRGDEIRLMQDPAAFQYSGGIYKKELKYLTKLGYTWESRGTYWIAKRG
jgi:RHS repeat-associated protein